MMMLCVQRFEYRYYTVDTGITVQDRKIRLHSHQKPGIPVMVQGEGAAGSKECLYGTALLYRAGSVVRFNNKGLACFTNRPMCGGGRVVVVLVFVSFKSFSFVFQPPFDVQQCLRLQTSFRVASW